MISIQTRRGPLTTRSIYFPSTAEVLAQLRELSPWNRLLIYQAPEEIQCVAHLQATPFRTLHLDLSLAEDVLWKALHADSCRYKIRRAAKLGSRLRVERNHAGLHRPYLTLANEFYRSKGLAAGLTAAHLQRYTQCGELFGAFRDDELVCAHLFLRDGNQRLRLMQSVSCRLSRPEASIEVGCINRFLHWNEIQTLRAEGVAIFDFGGISDATPEVASIAAFKRSFGGLEVVEANAQALGACARLATSLHAALKPRRARRQE